MKILSCRNAIDFASSITEVKKKDILFNIISNFEDNEMLVTIPDYKDLRDEDVLVIQSLSTNVNEALMELMFTLDLVNSSSPKSVKLLLTYMGYSRQDKQDRPQEAFSAKVIANILSLNYIKKIYVIDIHAGQTMGFFNIAAANIETDDIISELINKKLYNKNTVLVSGNYENLKKIIFLSKELNLEYAIALKYRPAASQNKILSTVGADVNGKDCIIIDDIIDSAGTIADISEQLFKHGAETISAIVTHGILSYKSIERIKNSKISKLFISNTIDSREKIRYIKQVETFSISNYALKNIMNDDVC